jgi:hypothetical protein
MTFQRVGDAQRSLVSAIGTAQHGFMRIVIACPVHRALSRLHEQRDHG